MKTYYRVHYIHPENDNGTKLFENLEDAIRWATDQYSWFKGKAWLAVCETNRETLTTRTIAEFHEI